MSTSFVTRSLFLYWVAIGFTTRFWLIVAFHFVSCQGSFFVWFQPVSSQDTVLLLGSTGFATRSRFPIEFRIVSCQGRIFVLFPQWKTGPCYETRGNQMKNWALVTKLMEIKWNTGTLLRNRRKSNEKTGPVFVVGFPWVSWQGPCFWLDV